MFPFSFFEASITDNNASLCPLNSFKVIFQTNIMQTFKKTTHMFSLCRSLILNLMYLCNFGSPRSEISSCGNNLSILSNPASLIKIGFSNEDLCQIPHNDLSIDWFTRANLYDIPWVTVSTLGSENDTQTNYSPSSFCNFLRKFNLMLRVKVMTIFLRWPFWNVIQGSAKTLTSSDYISDNIVRQDLKFRVVV